MSAKNKPVEIPARSVVSGCTFTGVNYDAKATEAITLIAQGLLANAQALGDLAKVFHNCGVQIDALLKVGTK